jgi:hypothetical protein
VGIAAYNAYRPSSRDSLTDQQLTNLRVAMGLWTKAGGTFKYVGMTNDSLLLRFVPRQRRLAARFAKLLTIPISVWSLD